MKRRDANRFTSSSVRFLSILFLLAGLILEPQLPTKKAFGQSSFGGSNNFFIDAQKSRFTRDGSKQVFEGDVVIIGPSSALAADSIEIDRTTGIFTGKGHVVLIGGREIFIGEEIVYDSNTENIVVTDAVFVSGDPKKAEAMISRVLGFNFEELKFEASRKSQLSKIQAKKRKMQENYRISQESDKTPTEDLVDRYALLLEQEDLIKNQENPYLAAQSPKMRNKLKSRREFWQSAKTALLNRSPQKKMYFRLSGDEITRTNLNDYKASQSVFTPCKCEDDESPAWGFRSKRVEMQQGGYADIYQAVLEVKGIPILYLPYMKIPIKNQRQSGFLFPTFRFDSKSGNVISQPVFFAFSDDLDATVTTGIFERRGTRLGLELRFQQKSYSGWEVKVETLRDDVWLEERKTREDVKGLMQEGLIRAAGSTDNASGPEELEALGLSEREYAKERYAQRSYWQSQESSCLEADNLDVCLQAIDNRLALPSNTWRGSYSWNGLSFFAPRLSLVSQGKVSSDHRYDDELFLPDEASPEALLSNETAPIFSRSMGQAHLDGKDFYAGVGTSLGDYLVNEEQFHGIQNTWRYNIQSRMISLIPMKRPLIPTYGQISVEQYRFDRLQPNEEDEATSRELTGGVWQRSHLKITQALNLNTIIKVDHFADIEARRVSHQGLSGQTSQIDSWRSALSFSLPIDGQMKLGSTNDAQDGLTIDRYLQHIMNWRVTFSTRPAVVRRGVYGEDRGSSNRILTFFPSDLPSYESGDRIPEVEMMTKHRRVIFSTAHSWRIYKRGWSLLPGKQKLSEQEAEAESKTFHARALRELRFMGDQPVTHEDEIFDEEDWLINRYQMNQFDFYTPVQLSSSISHDYLKEEQRQKQKRLIREAVLPETTNLIEPWSTLNSQLTLNLANWVLASNSEYNIYLKQAEKVNLTLRLPTIIKSSLSVGYTVESDDPITNPDTGIVTVKKTQTRSIGLSTGLIPNVGLTTSYSRRNRDNEKETYRTRVGITYSDSSDCWQLNLIRKKDFDEQEQQASYVLSLAVLFAGQKRAFPNLARPALRQVKSDTEDANFP